MITSVAFLSIDRARNLIPSRDTLMVSILDLQERRDLRLPRLGGYRSVLSLSFEDTSEEGKLKEVGSWDDDPDDIDHARFSQGYGERIPTLQDAKKIVEFVQRHHTSEESLKFIVHCRAGVSRSAAVAQWVVEYTLAPMRSDIRMNTSHANARLTRLLEKAHSPAPRVCFKP